MGFKLEVISDVAMQPKKIAKKACNSVIFSALCGLITVNQTA